METIGERVAALDVHKAQVTACVRVPGDSGGREPQVTEFSTTVAGLMALRDWLAAFRVTHVAMEATGVYWQPVWHILEDDFELTLCNARHVKQVPGRKTDVSDAQWLCQLMEAGLLRGSFVPPKPQRQLRTLTRYRKTQIAERQREANRLHKALEDTGESRSTASPADILKRFGPGDARRAREWHHRRRRARRSRPKAGCAPRSPKLRREALEGRFEVLHHALVIGAILQHLDFLDQQINRLFEAIEEQSLVLSASGVRLFRSTSPASPSEPLR